MAALLRAVDKWAEDSSAALDRAASAYARLVAFADGEGSSQPRRVAAFLAGVYSGRAFPFDLQQLRAVDAEISSDMLTCLDALRWGKSDLHHLIEDGERRVLSLIERWELDPMVSEDGKELA